MLKIYQNIINSIINKCHYKCKVPNTSTFIAIGINTSSTYQITKNNDISIPTITSIIATESSTITDNSRNTIIRVITVITTIINILISLQLLLLLSPLFILLS